MSAGPNFCLSNKAKQGQEEQEQRRQLLELLRSRLLLEPGHLAQLLQPAAGDQQPVAFPSPPISTNSSNNIGLDCSALSRCIGSGRMQSPLALRSPPATADLPITLFPSTVNSPFAAVAASVSTGGCLPASLNQFILAAHELEQQRRTHHIGGHISTTPSINVQQQQQQQPKREVSPNEIVELHRRVDAVESLADCRLVLHTIIDCCLGIAPPYVPPPAPAPAAVATGAEEKADNSPIAITHTTTTNPHCKNHESLGSGPVTLLLSSPSIANINFDPARATAPALISVVTHFPKKVGGEHGADSTTVKEITYDLQSLYAEFISSKRQSLLGGGTSSSSKDLPVHRSSSQSIYSASSPSKNLPSAFTRFVLQRTLGADMSRYTYCKLLGGGKRGYYPLTSQFVGGIAKFLSDGFGIAIDDSKGRLSMLHAVENIVINSCGNARKKVQYERKRRNREPDPQLAFPGAKLAAVSPNRYQFSPASLVGGDELSSVHLGGGKEAEKERKSCGIDQASEDPASESGAVVGMVVEPKSEVNLYQPRTYSRYERDSTSEEIEI